MSLSSISGLALAILLTQLHNHDDVQDFGGHICGFSVFHVYTCTMFVSIIGCVV